MRISDWSADVCSSDLNFSARVLFAGGVTAGLAPHLQAAGGAIDVETARARMIDTYAGMPYRPALVATLRLYLAALAEYDTPSLVHRSEEHTSELQSLMRISSAVFCLKKKKTLQPTINTTQHPTRE